MVFNTTFCSPIVPVFSPLLDKCALGGELKNSICLKLLQDSFDEWPNANVLPLPHEKILFKLVRISV